MSWACRWEYNPLSNFGAKIIINSFNATRNRLWPRRHEFEGCFGCLPSFCLLQAPDISRLVSYGDYSILYTACVSRLCPISVCVTLQQIYRLWGSQELASYHSHTQLPFLVLWGELVSSLASFFTFLSLLFSTSSSTPPPPSLLLLLFLPLGHLKMDTRLSTILCLVWVAVVSGCCVCRPGHRGHQQPSVLQSSMCPLPTLHCDTEWTSSAVRHYSVSHILVFYSETYMFVIPVYTCVSDIAILKRRSRLTHRIISCSNDGCYSVSSCWLTVAS